MVVEPPAPGHPDGRHDGPYPPATRRTLLAQERTLLAWWRTGIAAAAVALGVGGVVPHLARLPRERFLALGAGYGLLALFFIVGGTLRAARARGAFARNGYAAAPWLVMVAVTAYLVALVVLTVIALF